MIIKKVRILTLIIALIMMFSTVTLAAENDHFYKSNGILAYSSNRVRADVIAKNHVRALPNLFQIEIDSKLYDLTDANVAYAKDPINWKTILAEQYAIENLPIQPEEIPYTINFLEPNSIGNIYMEATYKNNSDYPITRYTLKILLKDVNKTTFLSSYDSVLLGETSPIFSTILSMMQISNDYEVLALEVTARPSKEKTLYIEYDFKLDEVSVDDKM